MAKATKNDHDLDSWVDRASKVIHGLMEKLKSTQDENSKLKEGNEKATSKLKSAVEAGEKLLVLALLVGTIALTLYYMPKSVPTEEVAANPPAHFLLSLVA